MADIIPQVALTLTKDPSFLRDILKFADFVHIKRSDRVILERKINNSTVNYYESTKTILEKWSTTGRPKTVGDLIRILKITGFRSVGKILANEFLPKTTLIYRSNEQKNTVYNVINPVSTFVGREEEMSQLDEFLREKRKRILVISGLGGQGKTQLCRKLIQRLKTRENFSKIIWLSGESDEALKNSLCNFLTDTSVAMNETNLQSFEEILEKLLSIVNHEEQFLWIIDDVSTEFEEFKMLVNFTFQNQENSKIIITSRRRPILPMMADDLTLEPLSSRDASMLFLSNMGRNPTEYDVAALYQEIGNHALALQLSFEFIKRKQILSIRGTATAILDFLPVFKRDKPYFFNKTEMMSGYNRPVLHHVQMTVDLFRKTDEPVADETLSILSLLCRDGVDVDLLVSILAETRPDHDDRTKVGEDVEKALNLLHSFSLISVELPIIRTHLVTQESMLIVSNTWMKIAGLMLSVIGTRNVPHRHLRHIIRIWEIISTNDSMLLKNVTKFEDIYKALARHSEFESLIQLTNFHKDNMFRLFGYNVKQHEIKMAVSYYAGALRLRGLVPEMRKRSLLELPKMLMTPKKPKTFKNFKLKSFLGSGSYGVVWKVGENDVDLALKVTLADKETEKKQEEEFALSLTLIHQNLIKLHSSEKFVVTESDLNTLKPDGGLKIPNTLFSALIHKGKTTVFLVRMELCGENLRNWLNTQHNPDLEEIKALQFSIVSGILEGIKYLHGKKIVHRDLKPENIVFSHEGFRLPVKIGDYGTCREVKDIDTFTATSNVGNELYGPPELMHGHYSVRSDLFSFGLIMWEVIQLIPTKNLRIYFDALVNDKNYEFIKSNGVIKDFHKIVTNLCMKKRQDRIRFRTAEEIVIVRCEEGIANQGCRIN